jgi:hypothetical protein
MSRLSRISFRFWLFMVCGLGLALSGCSQNVQYVPVEVKRQLPPPPPECDGYLAADLPAVPALDGRQQHSATKLAAHWAKHWLKARAVYRSARAKYAICTRYIAALRR